VGGVQGAGGGMTQAIERLPSKCEALSSNSSTVKKKKRKEKKRKEKELCMRKDKNTHGQTEMAVEIFKLILTD
jgi:hypothetical protein